MAEEKNVQNAQTKAPAKKKKKKAKGSGRIGRWFREMKSERKKVVWPTKKQSLNSTGVVIVVVIIAALIMILLDTVFGGIVRLMIGV